MDVSSKPLFGRPFSPRWFAGGILLGAFGFGLGYAWAGYGHEPLPAAALSPAQTACRTALSRYVTAGRRADVSPSFDEAVFGRPTVRELGVRYLADGCRPGALLAAMQLLRDRESAEGLR